MFNDDIEYNNDGTINQAAYDEEEYEFFQIMYGPKEQTDNWENDYISEEAEYDLNTSDYNDRDEFESAVEEAEFQREIQDDDLDSDDTDDGSFDSNTEFDDIDDDTNAAVFPEGFDFSRLRFTIGSEVKVTLDDDNSKKDTKTDFVPHTKSVQIKYYDKENKKYKVAEAVFDYFKIVRDNYDLTENTYIPDILYDLYNYDKDQAIKIWGWILEKFPKMLVNDGVNDWDTQAESYTGITFNNFHCIDNENDSAYIYDYVSKNKDIEETLFCKSYFGDDLLYLPEYMAYCVEQNLKENVERIYFGIVHHPFRNKKTCSLYKVLDDILAYCSINGVQNADPWFYTFFEKQIKGLNKPVKENALMLRLNAENYGKPIFSRPDSKTVDHKPLTIKPKIEEHSSDEDFDFVVDTVSQDEVAKLREELSMVKSKCETFEEQIKKLTAEIKTLKAQNEPEAYYCRIHFENSAKGQAFWYKCDDTTVKVGDRVTAPFGYKNDELVGTVVEAGYFKSCDFDFPISKMKAIIEKNS